MSHRLIVRIFRAISIIETSNYRLKSDEKPKNISGKRVFIAYYIVHVQLLHCIIIQIKLIQNSKNCSFSKNQSFTQSNQQSKSSRMTVNQHKFSR